VIGRSSTRDAQRSVGNVFDQEREARIFGKCQSPFAPHTVDPHSTSSYRSLPALACGPTTSKNPVHVGARNGGVDQSGLLGAGNESPVQRRTSRQHPRNEVQLGELPKVTCRARPRERQQFDVAAITQWDESIPRETTRMRTTIGHGEPALCKRTAGHSEVIDQKNDMIECGHLVYRMNPNPTNKSSAPPAAIKA